MRTSMHTQKNTKSGNIKQVAAEIGIQRWGLWISEKLMMVFQK